MAYYKVNNNAQNNGDHEVHVEGCRYYSQMESATDLDDHQNCQSAIALAKKYHSQVNGCAFCSPACDESQGRNIEGWSD